MLRHVTISLLLLIGCGGEVRKSDTTPGLDGSGVGGQGAGPGGGGTGLSSTALPACRRGFKPDGQTFRPCDFLADGLCYESKVDACACICPSKANTTCTSGFPVPDGRVIVTCQ
jgi:hypothetical protein